MSRGWNKAKVKAFKAAFHDFLQHVEISSKEGEGFETLHLYGAQRRFLTEVFEGLENDIHSFTILKARQLGISTIVRILILFWAFIHEGLRVALVYDTDSNRTDARAELQQILDRLPPTHSIAIKTHNRDYLELANGSRISYFVAGIKKSKGSGGLGRSRGINVAGCTEVSSWADIEGLKAFERSLAQQYDNRLYIWESTARGFNIFHKLWVNAKQDDLSKKAIFIGWWAKEAYSTDELSNGEALFDRYGTYPPTEEEQKKIDIVKQRYGFEISMAQLAWYRHEFDPDVDHDSESEEEGDEITRQELPWYEEEAFIQTGSQFFSIERLTSLTAEAYNYPFKGYRYFMSEEFLATHVEQVAVPRQAQLKIWEEPEPGAVYVIGADPAYGSSEDSNQYCIQVLRCYADGLDQVAEFCTVKLETFQFAWVIAHLCGAYRDARLLLEINGPGAAVLNGFRELESMARMGQLPGAIGDHNLKHVFDHIRHYLYSRQDALNQSPSGYHFIMSSKLKVLVMERLRDTLSLSQLRVRSVATLGEMKTISREGDVIAGEGEAQDDRVVALAIAVHAWETSEKKKLRAAGRTREIELKRKTMTQSDLQTLFSEKLVQNFFKQQNYDRMRALRDAKRNGRWGW